MARNFSARETHGPHPNSDCGADVPEWTQRLYAGKSVKLTISYLGTNYFGWQRTNTGRSIQEELETACSQICQEKITCEAASRTDRGVHASAQVVQFCLSKERPLEQLQRGINAILPPDIRVIDAQYLTFHPTLDASGKTYHYDFCLSPIQDPFVRHLSWHYPHPFNLSAMEKASLDLIGTHNFSAFTTDKKRNPICTLSKIDLIPLPKNRFRIALTGDRFLYKMARTIAGTLAQIGAGKLPHVGKIETRAQAGVTAPPHGLSLFKVYYENQRALPSGLPFSSIKRESRGQSPLVF